eukprot:gb/GECH01003262.1/.p1 GENE.gb/GECH01003262.1/~~gb/GECH01003262.1/.p1  ORF type:complete len:267 (+),score=61.53 gb/GECH01003262.1/:1-801(+)
MQLHYISIIGFFVTLIGYTGLSSLLQFHYYRKQRNQPNQWKIQHDKTQHLTNQQSIFSWWLPILRSKPNRAPYHDLFASINLLLAAIFQATGIEVSMREVGFLWQRYNPNTIGFTIVSVFLLFLYMNVAEYYWHRLMHIPFFYRRWHKIHHSYKSPEPFDDLYVHPIEQFGFMCILHFPSLIVPFSSYFYYILLNASQGILDHSGIDLNIPILYDSRIHDEHHRNFRCNYCFLSPIMDILHGTFHGEWAGYHFKYVPSSAVKKKKN